MKLKRFFFFYYICANPILETRAKERRSCECAVFVPSSEVSAKCSDMSLLCCASSEAWPVGQVMPGIRKPGNDTINHDKGALLLSHTWDNFLQRLHTPCRPETTGGHGAWPVGQNSKVCPAGHDSEEVQLIRDMSLHSSDSSGKGQQHSTKTCLDNKKSKYTLQVKLK